MRQPWQGDMDDHLDEEETQDMAAYADASDEQICREADLGDPAAYEIFQSWTEERRQAAIRAVDAADNG